MYKYIVPSIYFDLRKCIQITFREKVNINKSLIKVTVRFEIYFLASEIHFDIYFGKRLKPNVFSITKIF